MDSPCKRKSREISDATGVTGLECNDEFKDGYISLSTLCINARISILEFLSPRDLGRISIMSKSGFNDIADGDAMSLTVGI
jgi:hypothetical protein